MNMKSLVTRSSKEWEIYHQLEQGTYPGRKERKKYLLSTYYASGTGLSTFQITYLILTATLEGEYYTHFTDEKTETNRGKVTFPGSHSQ